MTPAPSHIVGWRFYFIHFFMCCRSASCYPFSMKDRRLVLLAVLIASGLAFSGYLSGTKFFTATCAFNEGCPYFLDYPACYFGFGMFIIMAILTIQYKFGGIMRNMLLGMLLAISGLGMLFAGYFTMDEIPAIFTEGVGAFMLGLPTCAYGLIVYIAIATISALTLAQRPRHEREP